MTALPYDGSAGALDVVGGPDDGASTAAPSRLMEQAFAIVMLAVGLAVLLGARSIDLRNETGGIDARFWPTAIGGGILLSALWVTFNAFTGRRAEREVEVATRTGWIQMLGTIGLTAAVLGVWSADVSFLILAQVLIIGLNALFGLRDVKSLLIFPAVMAGLLYLVFDLLLEVPL